MTDRDHTPQRHYQQDRPEEPAVTVEARVDRLERLVIQLQRAVIRMQEQALGS